MKRVDGHCFNGSVIISVRISDKSSDGRHAFVTEWASSTVSIGQSSASACHRCLTPSGVDNATSIQGGGGAMNEKSNVNSPGMKSGALAGHEIF